MACSSATSSGNVGVRPAAPRASALHAFLGGPHRPLVLEDLVPQLQLLGRVRQGEHRPRMAHGQTAGPKIVLDAARQAEQPKTVGDRAPILADSLGQLLLRPPNSVRIC